MECTPLSIAVLVGNELAVGLLLDHRPDVSARDRFGTTPLHEAAYTGDERSALLLLSKGADVSAKDNLTERTPLHIVANMGHEAMAGLLLANGADVSLKDIYGETAGGIATRRSHLQAAAMIQAEEASRAKCVAFAMGQHARLGAGSLVPELEVGVVRMVLEQM